MQQKRAAPRRRQRAPPRKRVPSNKTLNKKIQKINRNIELKESDMNIASTALNPVGIVRSFVDAIAQGTADNQRVGTMISPTSLQFRAYLRSNTTTVGPSTSRLIVAWDKQADQLNPPVSGANGVLDSTVVTNELLSPFNHDNIERYTILYDKVFTLNVNSSTSSTTTVPNGKYIKKKIKLSRNIRYGTIGAGVPITNNLVFIWLTDTLLAGQPTFEMGSRLYYKDS